MELKRYKVAPLPFQGQKRNFVEPFVSVLRELNQSQDIKVVVDLFGSSGLLSHTVKRILQVVRLFAMITTAFRLACVTLSARMSC